MNFIRLESAQLYILIDPEQIQIELRMKNAQNKWIIQILTAEDVLDILGCKLKI